MLLSVSFLALAGVVTAKIFDWDCTNSLGPCNNACFRVNCKGSPLPFTYDSNKANRDPRRTASGCNKSPCSKTKYKSFGNSCDEFPFASVTQGGSGATLRCVDTTENSSEGGQLGNFFKTIKNGDQFGITVVNYGGAGFCNNAQNCANDGGEFKLSNGNFVNAKNRRDEAAYFSPEASSNNKTGSPFRKFMGEDGVKRLWLSNDRNGTIVGHEVWSDGVGKIKITHEVFD